MVKEERLLKKITDGIDYRRSLQPLLTLPDASSFLGRQGVRRLVGEGKGRGEDNRRGREVARE